MRPSEFSNFELVFRWENRTQVHNTPLNCLFDRTVGGDEDELEKDTGDEDTCGEVRAW